MSEGSFLSRWSRRKQEQTPAEPVTEPTDQVDNASGVTPKVAIDDADHMAAQKTTIQQVGLKESDPDKSAFLPGDDLAQASNDLPVAHQASTDHTDASISDVQAKPLSDEDMPDVATLDGNSDVSGFFSEDVSEKLRKKALKAMFLSPEFNLRDGLEDYDDDFSIMPSLSEKVAASLRNWVDEKDPEEMLDKMTETHGAATESDEPIDPEIYDESAIKPQENNELIEDDQLKSDISTPSEVASTQNTA